MATRTQWGVMLPERESRGMEPIWDSQWTEQESREFVEQHPAATAVRRTVTYSDWEPATPGI